MRHIILLIFAVYCLEATTAKLENSVDLTWPFDENTMYWPNTRSFGFTRKFAGIRSDAIWYSANEFCTSEHAGTHLDAPYHFNALGWKVGDIPLSRLIVRGIMIDLTEEVKVLKDQARLLPKHLDAWVKKHGPIPDNSVILVKFGWSQYYSNRTQYLGMDRRRNLNFPGISIAAADWIVKSGKVVGVGADTASLDPGTNTNFSVHMTLSGSQIYGLENVKFPSEFPENNFVLYVMPMKIAKGTGAPLRLIAVPLATDIFLRNAGALTTPFYNYIMLCLVSYILTAYIRN